LVELLEKAFGISSERIIGPSWIQDSRFDIAAKLPAGASKKEVPEMLQSLLAERFKLSHHIERRQQPVYALAVGNGGVKVRKSSNTDAEATDCKGAFTGRRICTNTTMEQLAEMLTQLYTRRVVRDRA
jgi:uncharacterized protein (TIGR03435 family)